ncbi:MAG: hypothetical protein JWO30_186 [Fibrobacteres bacterium]|nr:hypothetical protein [Fibrobacterota bacterium]
MRLSIFTCLAAATFASAGTPPTKADSGWVSLFNGTSLDGFFAYFEGVGVADLAAQDAFYAENGMIHVPKAHAGGFTNLEGHLITRKQYSWYRVRVDYRFSAEGGSQNAGLVFHIDNDAALTGKTTAKRPRSIEINMRRAEDSPWTLWSATGLGPYIATTVKPGTQLFLPKTQGGTDWINDPWSETKRIVYSSFPNPEKPMGEWNHGEAYVYGDSLGRFLLNGELRTEGWNFRLRAVATDADPAKRIPCDRGGIAIQSEVNEIWYRNFEIMELEPHTLKPLNGKPVSLADHDSRAPRRLAGHGGLRPGLVGDGVTPDGRRVPAGKFPGWK